MAKPHGTVKPCTRSDVRAVLRALGNSMVKTKDRRVGTSLMTRATQAKNAPCHSRAIRLNFFTLLSLEPTIERQLLESPYPLRTLNPGGSGRGGGVVARPRRAAARPVQSTCGG